MCKTFKNRKKTNNYHILQISGVETNQLTKMIFYRIGNRSPLVYWSKRGSRRNEDYKRQYDGKLFNKKKRLKDIDFSIETKR